TVPDTPPLTGRKPKLATQVLPSITDSPDSKWGLKNGKITIKVFVPSTDDIWKLKVPHTITLSRFTSKVLSKLGFHVAFSGSCWDTSL
ncbi:hypothetical protein HYDPIDRAFT_115911, partial [Hydnomerulius pinastri MD-312]